MCCYGTYKKPKGGGKLNTKPNKVLRCIEDVDAIGFSHKTHANIISTSNIIATDQGHTNRITQEGIIHHVSAVTLNALAKGQEGAGRLGPCVLAGLIFLSQ